MRGGTRGAARQRLGREAELATYLAQSRPVLAALFRRYGVAWADAEDILQESILALVQNWESLEDPAAFLFSVVRRQVFQLLRRKRIAQNQVQFDEMLLDEMGGDCPQATVEAQHDARKLLAALPSRTGRIVQMRYGEQIPSREIASMLNCSDGSIRMTASRGLARLRLWAETLRYRR